MKKMLSSFLSKLVIHYIYPYFKVVNEHMDKLYDSIYDDYIDKLHHDIIDSQDKVSVNLDRVISENTSLIEYNEELLKRMDALEYQLFNKNDLKIENISGKSVLFLNDTYNDFHHGSSATSYVIKNRLLSVGSNVDSLKIDIIRKINDSPLLYDNFISEEYFKNWSINNEEIINKIKKCEALVVNGEGCISHYNKDTCQLLYIIYASSKYLNKRCYIINTSIYTSDYVNNISALEQREFEKILRLVVDSVDYVAVRDFYSYMNVNSFVITDHLKMSFDSLPLYVRDYYKKKDIIQEKYILISGGNFLPHNFEKYICELKKSIPSKYKDMQWFFLYCKVESAPCLDDLEHFKKLKKYGIKLVEAENIDEYLSVIDNAEFLISGRFHHSIAAFMLDTPFISFKTNTRKMEAIISMFEKSNVLLKNNYLNSTLRLLKSDDFFMKNSISKKEEIYRLAENNYVFLERK